MQIDKMQVGKLESWQNDKLLKMADWQNVSGEMTKHQYSDRVKRREQS